MYSRKVIHNDTGGIQYSVIISSCHNSYIDVIVRKSIGGVPCTHSMCGAVCRYEVLWDGHEYAYMV